MRFGRFRIDRERLTLEHDGEVLAVAPKSVELLLALVERPGEIVSKPELLDRLWPDRAVEEANLSQHVYVLRRVLEGCEPAARTAIVTVPSAATDSSRPRRRGVPSSPWPPRTRAPSLEW